MMVFDTAERRRRLAVRHALVPAAKAAGTAAVASRLVALHATDPASVFLAIQTRTAPAVTPAAIEDALYERRELVRMLGMRRTVYVVPAGLVPVVHASTMPRVAATQRARLLKLLGDAGVADPEPWLADVEASVLRALAARGGTAMAAELAADEPRLRTALLVAPGKPYQARQNITSRVLLGLGAQGRIIRGRPAPGCRSSTGGCWEPGRRPARCSLRTRHERSWPGTGWPPTVRRHWTT